MTDKQITTSRFFSKSDRMAAFIAANGTCAMCGAILSADFHADHVIPYRSGGSTTLDNVQALCPSCNLKKGGSMELDIFTPPGIRLRAWQKEAIDRYFSVIARVPFFLQATPGAGKTFFGCAIARTLLDIGKIDRVLVVAPSETLKFDWANDMAKFGVQLDPDCGSGKERTDAFIGKTTTYSTMAGVASSVERVIQRQQKTLVILDEVHHAGQNLSWGNGIENACSGAESVICMSGTPFRSDGKKIPFVRYDSNGCVVADYKYGYADAIYDSPQVCRAVYFPSYEGNMEWIQSNAFFKASFSDALNEKQESARLRSALWSSDWVLKTLNEAKSKLADIRSTHPDAAGLVVAMDKKHAEHIAKILEGITSSKPLIVTSDEKDAKDHIDAFRSKADPWIVAIKMVSEGIDIKRLRVCVYLSNVITELFFRQVVGRIVRYIPGIRDQEAFFYMPADGRLVEMAKHFQEERVQGLLQEGKSSGGEEYTDDDDGDFFEDWPPPPPKTTDLRVLSGEAWHDQTITYEGHAFSTQELDIAAQFAQKHGYPVMPEVMAKMLRDHPSMMGNKPHNGSKAVPVAPVEPPAYKQYNAVRQSTAKQERKCIAELIQRHLSSMDSNDAHRKIHGCLNRAIGVKKKENATEEQIKQRLKLLIDAVSSHGKPSWL